MAIFTPTWLQNGTYSARNDRIFSDVMFTEGVLRPGAGQFLVTQSSPAAMSVNVAAGYACITGDDSLDQGNYLVRSNATETVAIGAAPGSNSRIDLVVLRVNDPAAGGPAGDNATITVIAGTPAASPVVPAVPTSAIPLAQVLVVAGDTTVTNARITDRRGQSQTFLANTLTNAGDLLSFDGANTIRVPLGANGRPLVAGATSVSYAQLTDTGLASNAVTEAKIAANAVTTTKILDDAVTHTKRLRGAQYQRTNSTNQSIANVTTAKINYGTINNDTFVPGVTASGADTFTLPATYSGDYSVLVRLKITGNLTAGVGASLVINNGARGYAFPLVNLTDQTFCPVVALTAGTPFYTEITNSTGSSITITEARLEVRQLS